MKTEELDEIAANCLANLSEMQQVSIDEKESHLPRHEYELTHATFEFESRRRMSDTQDIVPVGNARRCPTEK